MYIVLQVSFNDSSLSTKNFKRKPFFRVAFAHLLSAGKPSTIITGRSSGQLSGNLPKPYSTSLHFQQLFFFHRVQCFNWL